MPIKILILCVLFCQTSNCSGINLFSGQTIKNTRIDADNGMICDQKGNFCQAEGNIKVTRGDVVLTCRKIKVQFHKSLITGKQEISKIYGDQAIRVENAVDHCFVTGSHLEFDAATQRLTLTGQPFLSHPKLTLKNATTMIIDAKKSQAMLLGHGIAISGERVIKADKIQAQFTSGLNNKTTLKDLVATNDVVISTPQEIARGQYGFFDNISQRGNLKGNVVITNSSGQICGDEATLDLTTNVSQIIDHNTNRSRTKILLVSRNKLINRQAAP